MKNMYLMRYVPKEFKSLVVDIRRGNEKQFNSLTHNWSYPLIIEWQNGTVSEFQNADFAYNNLKEFRTPNEFSL